MNGHRNCERRGSVGGEKVENVIFYGSEIEENIVSWVVFIQQLPDDRSCKSHSMMGRGDWVNKLSIHRDWSF